MKSNEGSRTTLKCFMFVLALCLVIGVCTSINNENSVQIAKEETLVATTVEENNIEYTNDRNIRRSPDSENGIASRSSTTRFENEIIKQKEEEEEQKRLAQIENIKNISISVGMDLTKRTGLTKEEFKMLIGNVKADTSKFFYDNSDLIYDLCEKYELNEIFFCGLISAESGWNIASNHRRTFNYISLMSNGKLIRYSSLEEGLEVAAKTLHNKYLTPGGSFYYGKTLSAVRTRFCPSGTWVNLVYGRMSQIVNSKYL